MAERQKKKVKIGNVARSSLGSNITDPRFANIQSDPRFRLPSKKHKVKLDSRFSHALEDDDFTRRAKVDRYGRPIRADAKREDLKRKYAFHEDEDSGEGSDDPDDDTEVRQELKKADRSRDVLREGKDSDSSDSSSSSDEDSDSDFQEAELAPQTRSEVPTGEVSSRLAVVNLDWDNIRAEDLMAVFSSFPDSGGRLEHVAIYPSEFGRERMRREEVEGPPQDIFAKSRSRDDEESESEDDEAIKSSILKPDDGTDFDSQALRRYQLERLRYFYAILTFSSSITAKTIYDAVDGTEYSSTANFFDLRFVPDSTDFSTDSPREECSSTPADYKPNTFITDALQHSKVKLTWDAEDTSRKEAVARAFRGGRKEIDENDLKAYLASDSSSGSEHDEEGPDEAIPSTTQSKKESSRVEMRTLLGLASKPTTSTKVKDKAPIGNVQITFSAGLSGNKADEADGGNKRGVFANTQEEANETTLGKYVRKERERKAKRREKAKAVREGRSIDDDEEGATDDAAENEDEDRGFEDPFFAEPAVASSQKGSSKMRKEERMKKKKEREEEEEKEKISRTQLEALMADDDNKGQKSKMRHFDMRDVERAAKAEKKKTHKRKEKKKDNVRETGVDDFNINATDPRFATRLYDNHEFAIDPTNPRYKGTKGMQALLEERRRRKDDGTKGSKEQHQSRKGEEKGEVRALVEKLKKRKEKTRV